jgi:hypothetical protein
VSDVQVFTGAEAGHVIRDVVERFREQLRQQASGVNNIEHPRQRAALMEQAYLLGEVEEALLAALGAPSRVGPVLHELADVPAVGVWPAGDMTWPGVR